MKNINRWQRRFNPAHERGLSLVELMVGLTIGLMLTLGLFTLIAGQSNTFKVQDDFARMQENATAALRYIGDSVRMAGFYGYAQDQASINITLGAVSTGTQDCGSATNLPALNWALDTQTPISGSADRTPANVNTMFPCIAGANFVTGPILVTRSALGYRIPDAAPVGDLTADLAAQANSSSTIYVQSDPNTGLMFYGNGFAALKAAGSTRSTPTGADVDIFEYRAHVYYLRPCSRAANGTTCAATDDGGRPVPTLVRQELAPLPAPAVGVGMTEIALVEGVERFDLRYGIDDLPNPNPASGGVGDGVPDRYTATPAAADWPNVVSIKVTVLVRSPTISAGFNDSGKTYDFDGDGNSDFDCTMVAGSCLYRRKVFSQTFQVRNRAQRRGA